MNDMVSLFTIIAVGFLLGMRHATDADHVIAVSTIVSREHKVRRSAVIGAAWGLGHTLTIVAVGGAIILFRIALPPRVGLAMELAVGIMLIVLGVKNVAGSALFPFSRKSIDAPADHAHGHLHPHEGFSADRLFQRFAAYQLARPLIVGIVHGLAGSAAIALLVLSTISDSRWAIAYLAVFGIGTVLGMMLITVTLGSTFAHAQKRFVHIGNHFGWAAGLVSVAFGLFLTWQIGFVDGLFTATAHWTPR
jgi:high-affinity nickel permease